MEIMKVASTTNPASLAGAIATSVTAEGKAEIRAIGAGAVNQAVKAIAVARGYVAASGKNLVCTPGFTTVVTDGEERTGIRFTVEAI